MGRHRLDPVKQYIFREEIQQAPAPDPLQFGVNMGGPSSSRSHRGTKRRYLPLIANLDSWWCQGLFRARLRLRLASLKTAASARR